MPTRFLVPLVLGCLVASNATAQAPAPNPNVANARRLWTEVSDYLRRAAADVPEALYSYRPTPDVRSFGELLGHVAGSEALYCALALGERPPAEDAVEKTATTKAALVAALAKSNRYCARAYQQTDAVAGGAITLYGRPSTRIFALLQNATHDSEHYGNIVTYMRLNKLVPPSSQPSK